MANSKKTEYKRRSDKQASITLIFGVATFIVGLVMTYVITTIGQRMTRLEQNQDQITSYYIDCSNKDSQLEAKLMDQHNRDLADLKDWLLAQIQKLK